MKRNIIICALALLCSCTFSNQKKAEKLIKERIKEVLQDPGSYESVSFTKLDTVLTSYLDDDGYKAAKKKADSIEAAFGFWKAVHPEYDGVGDLSHLKVNYYIKMTKYYSDQQINQLKIAEKISKDYQKKFKGWSITHVYRAKNGFGALGLHDITIVFNPKVDSILDVIQ